MILSYNACGFHSYNILHIFCFIASLEWILLPQYKGFQYKFLCLFLGKKLEKVRASWFETYILLWMAQSEKHKHGIQSGSVPKRVVVFREYHWKYLHYGRPFIFLLIVGLDCAVLARSGCTQWETDPGYSYIWYELHTEIPKETQNGWSSQGRWKSWEIHQGERNIIIFWGNSMLLNLVCHVVYLEYIKLGQWTKHIKGTYYFLCVVFVLCHNIT